ncbi:MAG TPA: uroporphyrinogen-III synthase [Sphingomicrobium sp.]|nr:uroporphyrinogen-III synthase [Sphingomicrobium sp.]
MRRVLVLRPEPGATATLRRARERGLDAHAVPLFEVEPVEWTVPDPKDFDALLLTSANAVRNGGPGLQALRELPVHAVGEATARVAREAGFDVATVGDWDVNRLLGSIRANLSLLHLCGEHRTVPDRARQPITAVPVYRSRAREGVDIGAAAGSLVLIHSSRAGARFAELVDGQAFDRRTIIIAAISRAAAEAAGSGWGAIETAASPHDDALLALAERLCNKSPGG